VHAIHVSAIKYTVQCPVPQPVSICLFLRSVVNVFSVVSRVRSRNVLPWRSRKNCPQLVPPSAIRPLHTFLSLDLWDLKLPNELNYGQLCGVYPASQGRSLSQWNWLHSWPLKGSLTLPLHLLPALKGRQWKPMHPKAEKQCSSPPCRQDNQPACLSEWQDSSLNTRFPQYSDKTWINIV